MNTQTLRTNAGVNNQSVKQIVEELSNDITWASISKKHFQKSRSWLSKKIHGGYDGTTASGFSDAERETLKLAFKDLASRLNAAAEKI